MVRPETKFAVIGFLMLLFAPSASALSVNGLTNLGLRVDDKNYESITPGFGLELTTKLGPLEFGGLFEKTYFNHEATSGADVPSFFGVLARIAFESESNYYFDLRAGVTRWSSASAYGYGFGAGYAVPLTPLITFMPRLGFKNVMLEESGKHSNLIVDIGFLISATIY